MHRPFEKIDSDTWIEVSGLVLRVLGDDEDGSRHQRFVLGISRKQTLLIAHNLGLADRAPIGIGDRVHIRGIYEWNDLGGVVHWTHRDPHSNEDAGYVRLGSRIYH